MSREQQVRVVPFVDTREMRDRTFLGIVAIAAIILAVLLAFAGTARADDPTITVDGVTYTATKISGPTIHFQTPDSNPSEAFTERHTWTGNGSENLPCEGGIHWIDNKNVLTISNCLESEGTTTTTVPPDTTTSTPETTTTVPVDSTTTTTPAASSSTSTVPPSITTTSTLPLTTSTMVKRDELPYTGAGDTVLLVLAGASLLATGVATLRSVHEGDGEV